MGIAAHQLHGYTLATVLHETTSTIVYRGTRDRDGLPIVIKLLKPDCPPLKDLARLRHEFGITWPLALDGVVKSYELIECGHRLALVVEDFGGRSLQSHLTQQTLGIGDILDIAVQLADTLVHLHARSIIHKDIKPGNIIYNPVTKITKLTDFSIASQHCQERPVPTIVTGLAGTLSYMSPEQTGRINRTIDHRTDLYSLGVTLYELLIGHPPFRSTDPMELVHSHIAKPPAAIEGVNPHVPAGLARVVMKLLEKSADDRYQSAQGLKSDLERCRAEWKQDEAIAPFPLAQNDHWQQLHLSDKLYGRTIETRSLLAAFHRVCQGGAELMLLEGHPGIGKSALVYEIHKPIVQRRGYFIAGKFDQFKRDVPYFALIQAFHELVRQIMAESAEQMQQWQQRLRHALGNNGGILTQMIPDLELITGQQPPIPLVSASESQNRLNVVIQSFVQVFATAEHPLVMFLDDLQWADLASLNLLQGILTSSAARHLLVIGAYRNTDIVTISPVTAIANQLQKAHITVTTITLDNLKLDDVVNLVCDALQCDRPTATPLCHLLIEKTQGNPFFLNQLIKTLHQDKLLTFNPDTHCWQWDLHHIQAQAITENVVDFMVNTIRRLPIAVQSTLQLAACLGNRFQLNTLSAMQQSPIETVKQELWEATQAGLVLPIQPSATADDPSEHSETAYQFLHDRIQQAAYALIPDDQKAATHLKVGRLLLQQTPPDRLEDVLFDAVNALNLGRSLITDPKELRQLVQWNFKAGRKAKASAAYRSALYYLETALELLPSEAWKVSYELALNLHLQAAEVAYLSTDYGRSHDLVTCIQHRARPGLDQAKAYEIQIQFHMAQSQLGEAIAAGLTALKQLDIKLPNITSIEDCDRLSQTLTLPTLDHLSDLPAMTDPRHLAALGIMRIVSSPAYQADPIAFYRLILAQVKLCLAHGHSAQAPFAYVAYGWLLCSQLDSLDKGYQAGLIALHLLDQFDAQSLHCCTYQIFETFIRHWQEPLHATLNPLLKAIQVGQETGDLSFASYAAMNYCTHLFLVGTSLEQVADAQYQHIELLTGLKQELQLHYTQILYQLTLNLQIPSVEPTVLSGRGMDEQEMIPNWEAISYHQALFLVYVSKLILGCIFGNFDRAVDAAIKAEAYVNSGAGLALSGVYRFYEMLAFLGRSQQTHESIPQTLLQKAMDYQPVVQRWATTAPMNYQHRADLITAEIAQLQGDVLTAMDGYDRAIERAMQQGYLHEAAIACERAAVFYISIGKDRIGQAYLTDAYYTYARWGAIAKTRHLEQQYAHILNPVLLHDSHTSTGARTTTTSTTASTSSHHGDLLDVATVIKASQAISSEIVLENLLDTFIEITIENAGAQRGVFLFKEEREWMIRAEKTAEQIGESVNAAAHAPMNQRSLPVSVIHYVANTHESLILDDACDVSTFFADQYIVVKKPRSVLCFPILKQDKLVSILYLENRLTAGAFTPNRCELLKVLMAQLAISIENAQLYTNLQAYSRRLENSSLELQVKNEALYQSELRERDRAKALTESLDQLKQTQAQLIQTEKISSLGQLVAGVAHEVNNPVGFISGNLTYAEEYTHDLMELLALYRHAMPMPPDAIAEKMEDIDLEYLLQDFPNLLSSMKVGIQRIRDIMSSLRTFSRMDTDEKQPANIHDGIDSTLLILQHRIKAKSYRPEIHIHKQYGDLPDVNCFAGQLNQVFMNLLANAIDAFDDINHDRTYADIEANPNQISITTAIDETWASILISDNGPGIDADTQAKLFEPFFTTKEAGRGTGLGLSISRQIIEEQHGGRLTLESEPGKGSLFTIQIPLH
jgi:predicted ATPase/signal transduction histidine kinase